jgi:hypothetical protein
MPHFFNAAVTKLHASRAEIIRIGRRAQEQRDADALL